MSAQTSRERIKRRALLSETMLLAIAPIVGYSYVYLFEAGRCSYFGVPIQFISITPTTVFAVASLFLILATSFAVGLLSFPSLKAISDPEDAPSPEKSVAETGVMGKAFLKTFVTVLRLVVLGALSFTAGIVSDVTGIVVAPWWQTAIALLAIFTLFVMVIAPQGNRYLVKSSNSIRDDPFVWLLLRIGPFGFIGIVLGIVSIGVAGIVGQLVASRSINHLVGEHDGKPIVVLANYGDDLVAAIYDNKAHVVSKTFYVINTSKEYPAHGLTLVETGALTTQPTARQ